MIGAYLKVQLSRFLTGKALARDVFLEMPRNGKTLRIAVMGDELRAELLDRLAARGVAYLLVPSQLTGETGETCELYLSWQSHEGVPEAGSLVLEAPEPILPDNRPENAETGSASAIGINVIAAAVDDTEAAETLTPKSASSTDAVSIRPSFPEPIREQAFSEGTLPPEPQRRLQEVQALAPVEGVAGEAREAEAETRLKAWITPEEQVTVISGLQEALEEITRLAEGEANRIGGEAITVLKNGLEDSLRTFSAQARQAPENAILAASATLEECITEFAQKAQTEQETALATEMRAAVEIARQRFAAAAAQLSLDESFTGRSETVFEKRFSAEKPQDDATEVHRSSNILGATALPEIHRDKGEIFETREPELHRDKADASFPAEAEACTNSVSETESSVFYSSDKSKNEESIAYATSARAATFKELPTNAARLAALLAYTLGYSNSQYLSDLALAVIAYFSRKDGIQLREPALPVLARALLDQTSDLAAPAVEDSIEIVRLLEAYFSNPECDRSLRDFSRRVFRDTLAELSGRPKGITSWNEARWAQAIDRGHSIEAQSLCGRASAAAIKISKELQA